MNRLGDSVAQDAVAQDAAAQDAAGWLLRLRQRPDDTALRQEFESWIAADERHAKAWDAARLMWQLAGTVGPALPAPANRNLPRGRRVLAVAVLAACFLLAFLPTLRLHWRADHLTTAGEVRFLDLDDGSRVQLDSASAVAISFGQSRRDVALLAGQAFFEVAPNRQRPFVVQAGEVAVTVTGTAFDVRMEHAGIVVEVESGSVRVDYPEHGTLAQTTLAPGQRLTLARDGSDVRMSTMDTGQIAPWRRGRLLIDSATIGQLVEEIRRYRPGLIVLTDDALAQRRVTGVFDLHDPLRALRAVVEPHAGKVREIAPWLVVVSAS